MKEKSMRPHCSLSIALALCLAVMSPLGAIAGELPEEQNQIRINELVDQAPTKGVANTAVTLGAADSENPQTPDTSVSGSLVINEVNSSPDDWVEVMNTGSQVLDISEWEIRDNSDDHRWQFPTGTTVQPGGLLLVKANSQGLVFDDAADAYINGIFDEAIGIGSGDSIRLYNKEKQLVDSHSWTEHANVNGDESASWGRYPDGTGSFVLMPETPNEKNSWYAPTVVINEVESNGDTTDWVEIYNAGTGDVDISGWYLYDNDPVGHAADITPVAEGTILKAGECFVFEENTHFSFGLGKADCAAVYNSDRIEIARYEWQAHAAGVYARIPDGTGEFVDFETATKGRLNIVVNPVVINEVQSKDPNGGADWIELANPTDLPLNIAGLILKDSDDTHGYTIPDGTVIPANGFLVLTEDDFGFGLGKGDSVRIFEDDMLIASTTWPDHTSPTWGLYPDVNGKEYRNTLKETPDAANEFDGIPKVIAWPGPDEVVTSDLTFLEDSSGLDFFNGRLYAVDNGTGKFWILDVAQDGTLSYVKGFENGKLVNFTTPSAKGPDTEGITVDGDGYVYLASERDNSDKGVNYNVILKADPNAQGSSQNAMQQWNLTDHLPDVAANTGIEAVEWVPVSEISGLLFDINTNAPFNPSVYPNATADGVFFVALEDNGHVYAFVLNVDGTVVLIADIDSKIGGAMALDYDSFEKKLWIAADDGFGNICAQAVFNGTNEPEITLAAPANGVDITRNNEGFAIAAPEFTVNGQRPVYRFADGVTSGALTVGFLNCNYTGGLTHAHCGTKLDGQPATAAENGWKDYYTCSCGKFFEDAACTKEINDLDSWKTGAGMIAAGISAPVEPAIIEGQNGSWTKGSNAGLTFKSDAKFSDFDSVLIDGKVIDAANYTVKEGSIIVTLKSDFLATLPVGKHTLGIVSANETAAAEFEIKTAAAATEPGDTTKPGETDKPAETNPNAGATGPQTGDNRSIFLWPPLLLASCGGLMGTAVYKKRRTSK